MPIQVSTNGHRKLGFCIVKQASTVLKKHGLPYKLDSFESNLLKFSLCGWLYNEELRMTLCSADRAHGHWFLFDNKAKEVSIGNDCSLPLTSQRTQATLLQLWCALLNLANEINSYSPLFRHVRVLGPQICQNLMIDLIPADLF